MAQFLLSSLAAGFGTAVVWMPTALSLLEERSKTNPFTIQLDRIVGATGFLSYFSCGASSGSTYSNICPLVFCGSVILVLAFLFFLNRGIPFRQKTAALGLLLIFILSFSFSFTDSVWHGFSTTNSFYHRYSFIFTFLLILLAQYQFHHSPDIPVKAATVVTVFLCGVLYFSCSRNPKNAEPVGLAVSMACIALVLLFTITMGRKKHLQHICLLALLVLELTANCYLCWENLLGIEDPLNTVSFSQYVQNTGHALDYIKAEDPDVYRIEKTYTRSKNDAALFNYAGLSHFSSTELVSTKSFMRKMGFPTHYNFWAAYSGGSTAETDAFLGVKYLMTDDPEEVDKDYNPVFSANGITVYENEAALPLGILSGGAVKDTALAEPDPFLLHDQIWQSMTGHSQPIFSAATHQVSYHNLNLTDNSDGTVLLTKIDPSQSASIRYEITVEKELPLYYYFSAWDPSCYAESPDTQDVTIRVNGEELGLYFDHTSWNMACAGTFSPGETVTIELIPNQEAISISGAWFYYEDETVLREHAARIQQQDLTLEKVSSSRLRGSFTADTGQVLLFTIPYEAGWHLKVDGQTTALYPVLDALLAADAPSGSHTFELYYIPSGFTAGSIMSIVTAAVFLAYLTVKKASRRRTSA